MMNWSFMDEVKLVLYNEVSGFTSKDAYYIV